MIEDCCCWLVDELLDKGASRSMVVDEGEPAMSIARGATTTRTGETTLYGGLKYSLNIDRLEKSLACHQEKLCTSLYLWIMKLIVTIPHNLCNLVVSEANSSQKFTDEVHELRSVPCHMFRASGVQIPENNMDNLSLTREEEDGTSVALDPQE
ncbi:hypothetical protein Tco_0377636 [Tanacetum coccineum]